MKIKYIVDNPASAEPLLSPSVKSFCEMFKPIEDAEMICNELFKRSAVRFCLSSLLANLPLSVLSHVVSVLNIPSFRITINFPQIFKLF